MRLAPDRRLARLLVPALALALAALLAGCALPWPAPGATPAATSAPAAPAGPPPASSPTRQPDAPSPSPARATPPAPTATPTPAGPKTVRIGMSQEPDSITGFPGGAYTAIVVQNLLFNVLVGVDDRLQPYPDLVESIPTLENGGARWIGEGAERQLQTTFRLRRDATWSDGKPVTSRDVRLTWELMLNPVAGAVNDLELKYERVDTPDERTVVFTMLSQSSARAAYARDPETYAGLKEQKGPVVDPLYSFGINGSWIYPEHVVGPLVDGQPRGSKKVADLFQRSRFARNPVGSGPYTLKDWRSGASVTGASITLAARRDYFRGAPRIDTVRFTFSGDTPALIDQLRTGELDVVTQDALDVGHAAALDILANVRAYYVPGIAWEHLDLNLDHPALKDRSVRQALYHAIDRPAIVQQALAGKSAPIGSIFASWSWAQGPEGAPAYDYSPARARELLAAAGWQEGPDGVRVRDGRRLSLRYVSTDWPVRVKVAGLLQEQLRQVGVELLVEHVASKAMLRPQTGRLALRSFDVGQYAWVGSFDPGVDAHYFYASTSIPSKTNGYRGGNYPGYRSAEADRLLAEGLASLDRQTRAALYQDLQKLIMSDLPTLPLFYVPNVSAASSRLVGFRPGVAAIGETWNVHEWDLR